MRRKSTAGWRLKAELAEFLKQVQQTIRDELEPFKHLLPREAVTRETHHCTRLAAEEEAHRLLDCVYSAAVQRVLTTSSTVFSKDTPAQQEQSDGSNESGCESLEDESTDVSRDGAQGEQEREVELQEEREFVPPSGNPAPADPEVDRPTAESGLQQPTEEELPSPVVPEAAPGGAEEEEVADEPGPEHPTNLGSMWHFQGCRPCAFWPSCAWGEYCGFCHYDHHVTPSSSQRQDGNSTEPDASPSHHPALGFLSFTIGFSLPWCASSAC